MSAHAKKGVNCLDCHQPATGQKKEDHHGFVIATHLTAGNCRSCHEAHLPGISAQPSCRASWAAIYGEKGLTPEQVSFSETYQPGGTRRPPHPFVTARGRLGDGQRLRAVPHHRQAQRRRHHRQLHRLPLPPHQFGRARPAAHHMRAMPHGSRPFADRNLRRVEAWRDVCRAGAAAQSQRQPKTLTTRDMFVPTCATCHMSGINGLKVTHDPSERLSYYLANAITQKRPNYVPAQANMKQVCTQCHTAATSSASMTRPSRWSPRPTPRSSRARHRDGLREDGSLTGPPFTNPIDFLYFDLWHYDGRTRSMAPSWAALTSCSGTATTPCSKRPFNSSTKPPSCGGNMRTSSLVARARQLIQHPRLRWAHDTQLWVEVFATSNLAILAGDIYIAHSVNQFHNPPNTSRFIFLLRACGSPSVHPAALGYGLTHPGATLATSSAGCRYSPAWLAWSIISRADSSSIAPSRASPTPRPS